MNKNSPLYLKPALMAALAFKQPSEALSCCLLTVAPQEQDTVAQRSTLPSLPPSPLPWKLFFREAVKSGFTVAPALPPSQITSSEGQVTGRMELIYLPRSSEVFTGVQSPALGSPQDPPWLREISACALTFSRLSNTRSCSAKCVCNPGEFFSN